MNLINSINQSVSATAGNGGAAKRAAAGKPGEFAALAKLGRKLPEGDPALARQAAANLLTELFFQPVLSEMRKFPFGAKFASGGRVEGIFGEQLDKRVADATALSDPGGITSALARALTPAAQKTLNSLPKRANDAQIETFKTSPASALAGAVDLQV